MTTGVDERVRRALHDAADAWSATPHLDELVDERLAAHERRHRTGRRAAVGGLVGFVATAVLVAALVAPSDDEHVQVPATPRAAVPGWHAVAEAPIGARFQHAAVWTGSEVVVFGGYLPGGDEAGGGAAYDPAAGTWRRIAQPPHGVRGASVATVAGGDVLVVGTGGDLFAYDIDEDEWRELGATPFASASNAVTLAAWTGDELLVVNGGSDVASAAAYDPAARRWRELAPPPFLPAFAHAAWTGTVLAVAHDVGGGGATHPRLQLWALDPTGGGSWEQLPPPPLADVERRSASFLVWTGSELVTGGGPSPDVAAFDPATASWRSLPAAPVGIEGLERYEETWTGAEVVLWADDGTAVALDPAAGSWRTVGPPPGGARADAPVVWTGHELVWWSGEPQATDTRPNECCTPSPDGVALVP